MITRKEMFIAYWKWAGTNLEWNTRWLAGKVRRRCGACRMPNPHHKLDCYDHGWHRMFFIPR